MNHKKIIVMMGVAMLLASCSLGESEQATVGDRWYTDSQVQKGRVVFANYCAVCHGKYAQGDVQWRKRRADGSYRPPPLNGNGHTWHHPLAYLRGTIRQGNVGIGGNMPSFSHQLSPQEIDAVIAFFQSKWKPEIYEAWRRR